MKVLHYIPLDDHIQDMVCVKCLTPVNQVGGSFTTDLSYWLTPPEGYERCLFDARVSRPVRHGI
jgi:hypothetical protein